MAGAGALSLNGALPLLEFGFIQRAQSDHEDVLAACWPAKARAPKP
jgi:GntR family transcriptional regulator of vanillate catabolism